MAEDGKYTEAGVAFLKKETLRLTTELSDLNDRRQTENESFRKDREEHERQRGLMKQALEGFEKMMLERFAIWGKKEKDLKESVATLLTESQYHTKLLSLARADLAALDIGEPDFSFAEQVRDLLLREIATLDIKRDEKLEFNTALDKEKEKMLDEMVSLREERKALEPELERLRVEIVIGNDKNGALGREYLSLEGKISDVKKRERAVYLMQRQLMPEYSEIYGRRCVKCGEET